jgi:hypothetical protein
MKYIGKRRAQEVLEGIDFREYGTFNRVRIGLERWYEERTRLQ